MSESPNMGLFGSKDEIKEPKEATTSKETLPSIVPYCIDSDSESYDDKALSIMDINDIIGVQSDPVGDSTLESEIAALSQIITDSKSDSNQKFLDIDYSTSREDTNLNERFSSVKDITQPSIQASENTFLGRESNFVTAAKPKSTTTAQQSKIGNEPVASVSKKELNTSSSESCNLVESKETESDDGESSKTMDFIQDSNSKTADSITIPEKCKLEETEEGNVVDNEVLDIKGNVEPEQKLELPVRNPSSEDVLQQTEEIKDDVQPVLDEILISEKEIDPELTGIDGNAELVAKDSLELKVQSVQKEECANDNSEIPKTTNGNDYKTEKDQGGNKVSDTNNEKPEPSETIPTIQAKADQEEVETAKEPDCNINEVLTNTEEVDTIITAIQEENTDSDTIINEKNVDEVTSNVPKVIQEDEAIPSVGTKEEPIKTVETDNHSIEATEIETVERKDDIQQKLDLPLPPEKSNEAMLVEVVNETVEVLTEDKVDSSTEEVDNLVEKMVSQDPKINESNIMCDIAEPIKEQLLVDESSPAGSEEVVFEKKPEQIISEPELAEDNFIHELSPAKEVMEIPNEDDSSTTSHISDNVETQETLPTEQEPAGTESLLPAAEEPPISEKIQDEHLVNKEADVGSSEKVSSQDDPQIIVSNEDFDEAPQISNTVLCTEFTPEKVENDLTEVSTVKQDEIQSSESSLPREVSTVEEVAESLEIVSENLQDKEEEDKQKSEVEEVNTEEIMKVQEEERKSAEDKVEPEIEKGEMNDASKTQLEEKDSAENKIEVVIQGIMQPKDNEEIANSIAQVPSELQEDNIEDNAVTVEESQCKTEEPESCDIKVIPEDKIVEDVVPEEIVAKTSSDEDLKLPLSKSEDLQQQSLECTEDTTSTDKAASVIEKSKNLPEGQVKELEDIGKKTKLNPPLEVENKTEALSKEIKIVQEEPVEEIRSPCPAVVTEVLPDEKIEVTVDKVSQESDDLKNILDTTAGVDEMFTDDQSQGTQNVMRNILDTVDNVADILRNVQPSAMVDDFKSILANEVSVEQEIAEVLSHSNDLPLVEEKVEDLPDKLPEDSSDLLNKDLDDPIGTQNIDSLEGLLGLDLIPEPEDPVLKVEPETSKVIAESHDDVQPKEKGMNVPLLLEDSEEPAVTPQHPNYITDVISNCLTTTNKSAQEDDDTSASIDKIVSDHNEEKKSTNLSKIAENVISDSTNKEDNNIDSQCQMETVSVLEENELEMSFELTTGIEENPLEDVSVLDSESKLDLAEDLLLATASQAEVLTDSASLISVCQPNSEMLELESAVKFLQESEEQAIDSPLGLSPKIIHSAVDDIVEQADAGLFVPEAVLCEDSSELVAELQGIASDPIAISEAEIISEATKLENERKAKLSETAKTIPETSPFLDNDLSVSEIDNSLPRSNIGVLAIATPIEVEEKIKESLVIKQDTLNPIAKLSENILTMSDSLPKMSILEERLKEPPKIEIPVHDMSRICEAPTTPKTSLLIQKDTKMAAYQKMLESPKSAEKTELKIMDTPRKDSEKHDFENVGSPRIILKIAKSAIADCGEPRSPKSPKIRSAANSPNPEDSPGQKLGKIKLKLSKGGHPSIISNENVDESAQWHTEGTSSPSPIGMKIKLSKTGDASIIPPDKHEANDEPREVKHKFEEAKRNESPLGMKFKLSKSGDASIVQQDFKETMSKHKEKSDVAQEAPKRTESPLGMKIKLSKYGDASIIQPDKQEEHRDKLENIQEIPKRTESPIGMKFKLSKTGDASIVPSDLPEESRESKPREKSEVPQEIPKRTDSPIGMKIKLSKTRGGASIIQPDSIEESKDKLEIPDVPKRTESPLGMKIKLSKSGDASIIHTEVTEEPKEFSSKYKEKSELASETGKQLESPIGVKIKVTRSGEASIIPPESSEETESLQDMPKRTESSIGMKIKLSKSGDASIIHPDKEDVVEEQKFKERTEPHPLDIPKRTESPIGMKIKLSKTGDASIIQSELPEETKESVARTVLAEKPEVEIPKQSDSPLGMKIKLSKTGDASIVESEKREKSQKRKEIDSPLEMKIKLSKTGHPTIVTSETYGETSQKIKESHDQGSPQKHKDPDTSKESPLKMLKTAHSNILQGNRTELTIEPVQLPAKRQDGGVELSPKRKEVMISPVEVKKSKLETKLSQILPEVTIQPVTSREQKQMLFESKNSAISKQQMNVISQEISITQVRSHKPPDLSMSEKLKDILNKNPSSSPMSSDCEIIEHRPELIIVNENSNSSQDVVIIEEVQQVQPSPQAKLPKKRGRPRRIQPPLLIGPPTDPLALDQAIPKATPKEPRENERPKRTCRSQKSYAPPKRGRGRGRGKRKMDKLEVPLGKKPRIDEDLTLIENSTMGLITLDNSIPQREMSATKTSELYKALKQPPMDRKGISTLMKIGHQSSSSVQKELELQMESYKDALATSSRVQIQTGPMIITQQLLDRKDENIPMQLMPGIMGKSEILINDKKSIHKLVEEAKSHPVDSKDILIVPEHQNWLTPSAKRQTEVAARTETISSVQVIDEETRMSAESNSRSHTPARNMTVPTSETIVNEESQGSVLSTATTESEKVKVKNRRMEINFDPDEGPFTVDKIAEYEWPLDRKGETFMIQEQISQYLGVKSFKRKYPDLKRRMVDMEERNYLRENALVSEAMCDMGLTAVCSSEVLDVMCSDFPDQYEEYRKHMREKQVKEHSKKQKELTAAANAERNRIDLAEMAVQSALSWNVNLNKARRESRKCSLDLQSFTIHVPKKQLKVETEREISHYPVALIPGQYTDYYREYTPAELRYYPLNTVLYGPMRPNERKFDSQSEGSQSDSDSDSSSDDSSSSSSEGTQDTEESQSTMDEVDMEIAAQKDENKSAKCKMCLKSLNKQNKYEVLIQCGTCNGNVHPSCIDLTLDMVPHIRAYSWQCTDCKTCVQCHDPADEDKMLFCDMCDRGYHIYCVGLRRVPQGRWHCQECAVCASCGSREAGGANSDRNSVALWQHEYKKGERNTRVYVSTFCVPCSKLWRKGRYCPHCSRCHTAPRLDLEANLVHCSACDKYLHLGCVENKGLAIDKKNYQCEFCIATRQQDAKSMASKTFKT
ncbi:titin isoform X1 [Cephus cinctus]|uniref:Titin isoform X1 n=1 Tax=Cephus cinctus TaxID=211228 RepID=A0AAJ7FDY8_CEPCN|nr:titin isoform X1 [Cephus cinctus]